MLGPAVSGFFRISPRSTRTSAHNKFILPANGTCSTKSISFLGPLILNKVWPIIEKAKLQSGTLDPLRFREVLLTHARKKLRDS